MTVQDFFKGVFEPELIEEIHQLGNLVKYPAGSEIIRHGQTVRSMPLILSGSVKVSKLNQDGKELLLYYVNPKESCAMTFTCCMRQKTSDIVAVAVDDVELIALPNHLMDEWMTRFYTWKDFVMQTIQARFDELLHAVDQLAFYNLHDRLVHYLKEKSVVSNSRLLNLSHEDVAKEMATSRVVISRLLKALENEEKLLLYRNQIKLLSAF